ncbi:DUF4280 domain-containing protein [Clostridium saccharoperbutylacetonicum]|uniref:DUF4280 domain-containing protein n=1 Tax=Clostridium saccharoperbutylacetonicum TaxID=36745 RepID=UPI0009840674|nr:DUF4280 domain-containing protein [Clostridium saccharoperbutylacetonicum]AQR94242.1 hypothetical protein CLSAP_15490 [Clostridium saccharoperbutylacetonicum]NSB29942.1 hypothetical protein [Clostridium saccharoperbutylacetonicum]
MAVYYIVRGAKMKCDKGSNLRKINLPVSHGSYAKGNPLLNKTDSKPVDNIPYFGVCANEGRLPQQIDITVINKDGAIQIGKKCMLQIQGQWQNAKGDTLIDGQPALTTDSKIFCDCGGVITFDNHGQD